MKSPEYYVESLEVNIEPNLKDIDFGISSLDFEVDDSPEFDEELEGLLFESNIGLTLKCYPAPIHDLNREEEEEVGTAEIEVLVLVEGSEEEFEEHIAAWEDEGYRNLDWGFRYHIESGFTTEVFSPVAEVVNNSFRGVLPGLAFTEPPSRGPEELPVDRSEFLREYLKQNLMSAVLEHLTEVDGFDVSREDVGIEISEDFEEIVVDTPDRIDGEFDEQELGEVLSSVFRRVINEEAGEAENLRSIDFTTVE